MTIERGALQNVRDTWLRRWVRRAERVPWLGPGLVAAATAIGASHLVLVPTAGARFGYALLWLVLFSHLFKYPAFDFGPRYAVATGRTLLDGYARLPGPRGWALWIFLLGTLVQGVTVLAGVLGVAAAVASAVVPAPGVPAWSLILGLLIAWLLRSGGFDGLSYLSKLMLGVLGVMTLTAFLATPPPAAAWKHMVIPEIPVGSLVLIAAILGWMPTGIDVSVWHSMWALERRDAWSRRAVERGDPRGAMGPALLDMRVGYGVSLTLGLLFLALGAEVLGRAGVVPEGAEVAVTLARMYTDVLGEWSLPFFMAAAFFGMFSTSYGVMDGFPRAFAGTVRRLRMASGGPNSGAGSETRSSGGDAEPAAESGRSDVPSTEDRSPVYWGFLVVTLVAALAETWLLPDPVRLVTVAAVASFLLSPVTFVLNYACVTRHVAPDDGRPGRLLRTWAVLGIACSWGAAGLFLWVTFGGPA